MELFCWLRQEPKVPQSMFGCAKMCSLGHLESFRVIFGEKMDSRKCSLRFFFQSHGTGRCDICRTLFKAFRRQVR